MRASISKLLCSLAILSAALTGLPAASQVRVNGAIQEHGFLGRAIPPAEVAIVHGSEFKGARKVAISVFDVAFAHENHFTANSHGHQLLGGLSSSARSSMSTTMSGVDHATQQRIADRAYAMFVDQLKAAGYEVVDQAELGRRAPEFAQWEALPNFSEGRFGTYVAPTGQSLRFLQGDAAKRDTSGMFGQQTAAFRVLDTPLAFKRSPYIARDADLGIIAVTLVVDYGVYSSSGENNRLGAGARTGFLPGVAIAAGNVADHGTLLEYWGTHSGGFPAYALVQQPIRSERPFGAQQDVSHSALDAAIVADPKLYEAAANEVIDQASLKLVSVMAAGR
jgi:hypothetical protein